MLQLDLNWKLTLTTTVLFPVLLMLGFWQLDREQEKRAVQQLHEQRSLQAPVDLHSLPTTGTDSVDLAYLRVHLRGEYLNDRNFLLDNRLHESRPGYELITPFRTDDRVVFVNRGWLPMGPSRQQLPALPAVDGEVRLQGTIYVPPGETFVLSDVQEQAPGQWPQVIQRIDIDRMTEALETAVGVFPFSVRLAEHSPGALLAEWPVISMSPETHRGYAVQWFTMAAVLLLLFFYVSIKRRET